METRKERLYRYFLYALLMLTTLGLLLVFHFGVRRKIPDEYLISSQKETQIDFPLPVCVSVCAVNQSSDSKVKTRLQNTFSFRAGDCPCYVLDVSAFGVIPIKQIKLQNASPQKVYISGKPVGIYVKTIGVMVVDTGSFTSQSMQEISPADGILMSGDYILKVNKTNIQSKRQLIRLVEQSKGEQFIFTIIRNGEISKVAITPEKNEQGIYKAGIWIRDSAQGIGTLTFLTEDGEFAALGHGINDCDTGKLMSIERGSIYETDILTIQKAQGSIPGQMTGILTLDDSDYLGSIWGNTKMGIYGALESDEKMENKLKEEGFLYETAFKQEIKKGSAKILSNISGKSKLYDIEILDISFHDGYKNQNILLKVTDEELLARTGGIVQGMSGSPIIQNGKLIGAVTHVFVNDPTRGYGIFIENMLEH